MTQASRPPGDCPSPTGPQPAADLARVRALDEMGRVVACADRASDDDQSFVDQAIHERGVVTPAILLGDAASVFPRRTVDQGAQEEGHESKLAMLNRLDRLRDYRRLEYVPTASAVRTAR